MDYSPKGGPCSVIAHTVLRRPIIGCVIVVVLCCTGYKTYKTVHASSPPVTETAAAPRVADQPAPALTVVTPPCQAHDPLVLAPATCPCTCGLTDEQLRQIARDVARSTGQPVDNIRVIVVNPNDSQ